MLRIIQLTAVALLLCLTLAPAPAQANWNRVMRFFGEFWSDGYHSKGDYWNQPPRHPAPRPAYQPYYPMMQQPTPVIHDSAPIMHESNSMMHETISTPMLEAPPIITGVPSK